MAQLNVQCASLPSRRSDMRRLTALSFVLTAVSLAADLSSHTPPASARPDQQSTAPQGAVARCRNGGYVFVATGDATCAGAGGVAESLQPNPPTPPGSTAAGSAQPAKIPPAPLEVVQNRRDGLKYVRVPAGAFQMGCST